MGKENASNRSQGGESAPELFTRVYEELHTIASRFLRRERSGHTLQTTALLHEAYLRVTADEPDHWRDEAHFIALAARVMRRVLVEQSRAHRATKRGSGRGGLHLDQVTIEVENKEVDLLVLDEALSRLEAVDPTQSRIVEMRFFGGLSGEEIARTLELSSSRVKREWSMAKAWLYRELA